MNFSNTFPACLLLLVASAGAFAQAQSDPTRPSAAWTAAQSRAGGKPAPVEAGPQDARIQVSSGQRRFVVIDGKVVRPGETYNGAKLISVSAAGAVWQRDGVRENHDMNASVRKTTRDVRHATATRGGKKPNDKVNGEK